LTSNSYKSNGIKYEKPILIVNKLEKPDEYFMEGGAIEKNI